MAAANLLGGQKSLTIFTPNLLARYINTFGYSLIKDQPYRSGTIEYLYNHTLPLYDYINHEKKKNVKIIALGEGTHYVPYKEYVMSIHNTYNFDVRMHVVDETEIIKRVTISIYKRPHSIEDTADEEILTQYVEDAKTYCECLMDVQVDGKKKIKKYIFNEKYSEWTVMNVVKQRCLDSVFLDDGIRDKLMTSIKDFMDPQVRDDYWRFNIPHKLNILLHGKPGTGKTSTIMAIASELNCDVAVLQFTRNINDNTLLQSINSISNLERCKIVVMEDIDCLFHNRKENDTNQNAVSLSGLLNAMDGLGRAEGIIMIMTTNNVNVLDPALLRSGRVDLRIKYDVASLEQMKSMFRYYFKDQIDDAFIERFFDTVEHKDVSISMLQQHLFNHRKNPRELLSSTCMNELNELIQINKALSERMRTQQGNSDDDQSKRELFYT